MIAAFFHDAPLVVNNNKQVYSVSFTYNIWERYLQVFDSLVVSTRVRFENSIETNMTKNLKLSSGPRVVFKPISNYKKKTDGLLNKKNIKNQIRETLKQVDCAIIRLPSFIGLIACDIAEELGKPYVIEVVGCTWDAFSNHGSKVGKIIAPFSFYTMRKAIARSKFTIYITKEFLQSRYPSLGKTCICPNVRIDKVDKQILINRIKKIESKVEEDIIVFGLIGSLNVSYKGHETVIKAISLIKDTLPKFRIEFLGNGDTERWIKLAKEFGILENIVFIGTLPSGEAVYNWIDNLDISLQPSSAEAQGRSIIEEMSRGCPVIASQVGGIVELLDNDYLIKSGDYKNLSKKILELISEKESMKQQAEKNFYEAGQYYNNNIELKRKEFLNEFREYVEMEKRDGRN